MNIGDLVDAVNQFTGTEKRLEKTALKAEEQALESTERDVIVVRNGVLVGAGMVVGGLLIATAMFLKFSAKGQKVAADVLVKESKILTKSTDNLVDKSADVTNNLIDTMRENPELATDLKDISGDFGKIADATFEVAKFGVKAIEIVDPILSVAEVL